MCMNAHCSFICNCKKQETTQTSINKWMDKQIIEYIHTIGMLLSHIKEYIIDRCNMGESQNHYTVWKNLY